MIYTSHENYRKAWDDSELIDPPVPLNIDLELASICNLRCPMCFIPDPSFEDFISQKSEDGKPLRRVMSTEMAFKIIDQAAEIGVPAIKFNWRGESTIAPNYSKIVSYASEKTMMSGSFGADGYTEEPSFFELLSNTNANCPDAALDGLMKCTKVMISLDSMVPETYLKMRVGGNLDKAKGTINKLIKRGHKNVWVRRVLTKENYKEDFFGMVRSEWGDKVHVSQHYCFDRNINNYMEISGCDHDQDMPRKYCQYPSQRLVITSRGMVYPCCIDLHETIPVGDINKQTLLEIWNGEPMKKLRSDLRSNDVSKMNPTCQHCESWMSYDVDQRNFVKDIEIIEQSGNKII